MQLSGKTGLINKGGKLIGIVGISCSVYLGYENYKKGNIDGVIKSAIDTVFGIAGFFGPIGFIISSAYFLIDPLGEKPLTDIHRVHEASPIDNLRTVKKSAEIYVPNRYKLGQIPK